MFFVACVMKKIPRNTISISGMEKYSMNSSSPSTVSPDANSCGRLCETSWRSVSMSFV